MSGKTITKKNKCNLFLSFGTYHLKRHLNRKMDNEQKQEQFMKLYEPLSRRLSSFAFSLTHNRENAKDLVCETVLAAYQSFEKLENEKAFLSFLFTIARRLYLKSFRNSKKIIYIDPDEFEELYSDSLSPENQMDVQNLYDAMNLLPFEQKEAIYLFDIMGISQKEISMIQNTTIVNVKLRIFRGKKKLKLLLTHSNDNVKDGMKILMNKNFA